MRANVSQENLMTSHPPYWTLAESRVDSTIFFRELTRHFPEATSLFIEGSSIAEDVTSLLSFHTQEGPYLPIHGSNGALFGKSKIKYFRCGFSVTLLSDIEQLSEIHAEPEICDHLIVYVGDDPLLEFYDFPKNEIWIHAHISEDRVRSFATSIGTTYKMECNG